MIVDAMKGRRGGADPKGGRIQWIYKRGSGPRTIGRFYFDVNAVIRRISKQCSSLK